MPQTSIVVQLDPAVEARLAALAEDRQQPVGEGVSNERVTEWLDSWGTENELPAPNEDPLVSYGRLGP